EPDSPIRMHRQIIRRVEFLVLETIHQHRDRAIVFGSRYPARIVLAGEQPAVSVPTPAVAVVRRATENADLSSLLQPSQHAIVGDAAEEKIPPLRKPYKPFRPRPPT